MYSNRKDQINLESIYNKVHNNTINEDANESITAVSVVYGAMILIPLVIQFLKNRYGSSIDLDDVNKQIISFLDNKNIQKDVEHQGMGYVKSNIINMIKKTTGETEQQGKAIEDVKKIFPDDNNQSIIQKAKSWLKNTISNQEMQNMRQNVKKDILGLSRPDARGYRA
jgi:hypothetical protein